MDDLATVALWISGVSLLVAASSLSWQIFNALRVDRARLTVAVESRVLVRKPGYPAEDVVFVQATNAGKRATYLTGLWLGLGRSRWPIWKRLLPKSLRGEFLSGTLVPGHLNQELGTSIPVRLEAGDLAIAVYERQLVERRLKEFGSESVWGFALSSTSVVRGRSKPLDEAQQARSAAQADAMIPES